MDSLSVLYRLSTLLPNPSSTVTISTKRFGELIGLSQQSASRILAVLAEEGFIEKTVSGRGHKIGLAKRGVSALEEMRRNLDNLFAGEESITLEGAVSKGLGEGAYYVQAYQNALRKRLGFTPYPGTLNVRLDKRPQELLRYTSIEVPGFVREGRSYGVIRLAPVTLRHRGKDVDCLFVLPERTHHREEAEFISEVSLREKLGLDDGSKVKVSFRV